jgi:pilus assembly protein Flp/PilA
MKNRKLLKFLLGLVDSRDMTYLNLFLMRLHTANLRSSVSRQEGQALIEYALIISLIALVAIVALQTTGTNIKGVLNTIAGEV